MNTNDLLTNELTEAFITENRKMNTGLVEHPSSCLRPPAGLPACFTEGLVFLLGL